MYTVCIPLAKGISRKPTVWNIDESQVDVAHARKHYFHLHNVAVVAGWNASERK